MKKLFWGFFFILLDLHFNTETNGVVTSSIDVLPDLVGWLLLLRGAGQLAAESGLWRGLRPLAMGMTAYTGLLWAGELLGAVPSSGVLATLALPAEGAAVWALAAAIGEAESRRGAELNGQGVRRARTALLAAILVQAAGGLLVRGAPAAALGGVRSVLALLLAVWGAVMLAAMAWFLAALWKSAERYEALPPRGAEPENDKTAEGA